MKKIILNLLCLTTILCLTTGCGEQSVETLMEERYGISSAEEISREDFKGDSNCGTDYYITGAFKDNLFKKVEFHIHQSYSYGMESCNAGYEDDFKDMKLNEYFDSFKNKKNLTKEYKTIYLKDNKYPFNKFQALGTFNNKAELESLLEELELFNEHISKQKYNKIRIPYVFTKNTEYFHYEISNYWTNSEEALENYLEQIIKKYDVDAMKEFSEKEIQQVLSQNRRVGIKTNDTCNSTDKYMAIDYSSISMGALYYLLQDMGYTVVGNQYNYTSTINSHTLSCNTYSNETFTCRIDGRIIGKLNYDFTDLDGAISFTDLNDLLDLNLCSVYSIN